MGMLEDVRINIRQNDSQYLILRCNDRAGFDDHYFAISDHPSLVEITGEGKVVLKVNKENLYEAVSIPADEIPVHDDKTNAVYKLINYSKTAYQAFK